MEQFSLRDRLIYICAIRSMISYVTDKELKRELLDKIVDLELLIDKQVLIGVNSSFYR